MMSKTMSTNQTNIEKAVMRRVHRIYYLRPLVSGGTLSVLIAALSLYGIGREVWVARVFENAPSDFFAILRFFVYAFQHTDLLVQVLALLALLSVMYLARESARAIVGTLAFKRA
jgi:hypothetical protein